MRVYDNLNRQGSWIALFRHQGLLLRYNDKPISDSGHTRHRNRIGAENVGAETLWSNPSPKSDSIISA